MRHLRALLSAFLLAAGLTVGLSGVLSGSAKAETFSPYGGWLSEVRLGLLNHDVDLPSVIDHKLEQGLDITGEILFERPSFFKYILNPRPHFGVSVNTAGSTNYLYTGFTWGGDMESGLILEGFFGFAAHDGYTDVSTLDFNYDKKKLLGSRILFHLGLEAGFRITDNTALTLRWAHLSNGNILTDGPNRGLDNVGLRIGYRF